MDDMQQMYWPVDVMLLPSVKLHLSQPAEEGVLHGETPSSASETVGEIDFHKTSNKMLSSLNKRQLTGNTDAIHLHPCPVRPSPF